MKSTKYYQMYHLANKGSIFRSHLGHLSNRLTPERRIATVRTLDASNFTVNALHQENIAGIAIAMVAAITMRTNLSERRLLGLYWRGTRMRSDRK